MDTNYKLCIVIEMLLSKPLVNFVTFPEQVL